MRCIHENSEKCIEQIVGELAIHKILKLGDDCNLVPLMATMRLIADTVTLCPPEGFEDDLHDTVSVPQGSSATTTANSRQRIVMCRKALQHLQLQFCVWRPLRTEHQPHDMPTKMTES
jgi:hypothetical protein